MESPAASSPDSMHEEESGGDQSQREDDSTAKQPKNVSIRERLSHFTWSWYECTMSTGALAALISQQPFSFTGLQTIGKIFFILDLVLFLAFTCLIIYRFTCTSASLGKSLHHPNESFFFGTFWVSIALILYNTQQYGVPSCGPWLVKALEVLFWIYAGCAILVAVFQYHVIFDEEDLPVAEAMPAWVLPVYPFLILGPLASVLENSQTQASGVSIMIGGILFQGLGWMFAFIMYTIYLTRLINSEIPSPSKRPGMYVAVGPAAYTANTLVALGLAAPKVIPDDYLGITTIPVGDVWKAIAVPAGIFLWLLGFWFFALSTVSVFWGIRKMYFTLNYWAFIFPNVGLTIAAIYIGTALDSTGIKAVTSGATVLLVLTWFFCAGANIRAVWKRQILWPGMDEDEEDVGGHTENAWKND